MTTPQSRDLLLKIGDGGAPETFSLLGAARLIEMAVDNPILDATSMNGAGIETVTAAAGVQRMEIALDGTFKNTAAEDALRAAALGRTSANYQLCFPDGDVYTASFVVARYRRGGDAERKTFEAQLVRTGAGSLA
jgi:predicted secreted protein